VLCYYRNVAEAALYAECPIRLFIGYESAKPVATAEVTFGCGAAGIYSVATLEDYRRRGFATAIVSHALSAAKHEGLGLAFLQSSERNAGIYERLGFETYGLITEYKPRTLRC
jgi:ribosomal protein S18 acetylase RimI-like enzyme